jgi:type IV secretion system protein VirB9
MSKKTKIFFTIFCLVIFALINNISDVLQKPILTAKAADVALPSENKASQLDRENTDVTSDVSNGILFDDSGEDGKKIIEQDDLEIMLDGRGNVIGWKRKQNENDVPFQLPSRNTRTDEEGNTIIEVDDPDSIIFDQKLFEVEKLPEIRPVDEAAIELAEAYSAAAEAPRPFMAAQNGRINFYYGTMNPRIICRPLRLTDIELEPGEQIKNVHISDSARWSVSGAWSGDLESLVTHVILKPQLPDIAANLLIHTDRRTYSIELISLTTEQYMPHVGFLYPETTQQANIADSESWENLLKQYQLANNEKAEKNEKNKQSNARLADPASIYMDYAIKVTRGENIAWKPKHAYAASGKTYIVMPDKMQITESPVFFVKQNGREKLTNYRVEGNIYIIDRIFDLGILTVGKDRVAISRKTPIGKPEKEITPAKKTDTAPKKGNTRSLSTPISEDTTPTAAAMPEKKPIEADVPNKEYSSEKKDDMENTKPVDRDWKSSWDTLLKKYGMDGTSKTREGQKNGE